MILAKNSILIKLPILLLVSLLSLSKSLLVSYILFALGLLVITFMLLLVLLYAKLLISGLRKILPEGRKENNFNI